MIVIKTLRQHFLMTPAGLLLLVVGGLFTACGSEELGTEEAEILQEASSNEWGAKGSENLRLDKAAIIENILEHVRLSRVMDLNYDGDFDYGEEEFVTVVDLNGDGTEDLQDVEEAKRRVRLTLDRNRQLPPAFLLRVAHGLDQAELKIKQLYSDQEKETDADVQALLKEKGEQVIAYQTNILVTPNQGGLYSDGGNGVLGDGTTADLSVSNTNGYFNGPFLGVLQGAGDDTQVANDKGRYSVLIHEFVHVVFRYMIDKEKEYLLKKADVLRKHFRAPANAYNPEEAMCSAWAQLMLGGDYRRELEPIERSLTSIYKPHEAFAMEHGLGYIEGQEAREEVVRERSTEESGDVSNEEAEPQQDSGHIGIGEVVCGDGVVARSEACDDGNVADGDGCSSTCELE